MSNIPDIKWLASGEPYSEQFQDYYFSTDGGLEETEYVFLKQNGFPQRFIQSTDHQETAAIKIAETGFGTGLNFLVTLYHWLQTPEPKKPVHYIAVEKYPFSKVLLSRIYTLFSEQWPQLDEPCRVLLDAWSDSLNPQSVFKCSFFEQRFKLMLLNGDAQQELSALLPQHKQSIDAWYLDGFAPARNPDMWQQALFNSLYQLSKPGTTLSTFTAAGFVRRGLIDAGFTINKIPGLGKKREIIRGEITV